MNENDYQMMQWADDGGPTRDEDNTELSSEPDAMCEWANSINAEVHKMPAIAWTNPTKIESKHTRPMRAEDEETNASERKYLALHTNGLHCYTVHDGGKPRFSMNAFLDAASVHNLEIPALARKAD